MEYLILSLSTRNPSKRPLSITLSIILLNMLAARVKRKGERGKRISLSEPFGHLDPSFGISTNAKDFLWKENVKDLRNRTFVHFLDTLEGKRIEEHLKVRNNQFNCYSALSLGV